MHSSLPNHLRRVTLISLAVIIATGAARAADTLPALASKADFWSFKPPVRPEIPQVAPGSVVRNPIDAFVIARLSVEKLLPSPEADRQTLIRRVSFDLTGLPPTPEEVDAFVHDTRPDAYKQLVDRLLASPRYGERWARHWLDVVRFADTHGFEMNQPRPNAWPYRDYVIAAFNNNTPYDRFIREQIAGDSLGCEDATGYLVAGPWDQVKSPDPVLTAQQRADELHDMVSNTGATFLGLTIGCARCHDHKFDAISQTDYYRLTAVLAGTQHGEHDRRLPADAVRDKKLADIRGQIHEIDIQRDTVEPFAHVSTPPIPQTRAPVRIQRNIDHFAPVEARFVRFTVTATNTGAEPCIDELEIGAADDVRNVALATAGAHASASGTLPGHAIHKLEHINDGQYGNARSWISNEPGRGWVEISLAKPTRIDRVIWGRDQSGAFTDRLPTAYRIEVATEEGQWQTVATSDDRAMPPAGTAPNAIPDPTELLAAKSTPEAAKARQLLDQRHMLEAQLTSAVGTSKVYGGVFNNPPEMHRLNRGDPMQPKEAVTPGGIAELHPALAMKPDASDMQRRAALAAWLTDPANPLPARVMVNRLWQHHFGRGIVATPSDFGHMGVRPTHPELLDWLATEFVARGWDLKAIQRLIVTSATYRQSGAPTEAGIAADAGATLLWRFPPQRLEAEPIRDTILFISGKLQLTGGGPGFDLFKPNENYVRVYIPKTEFGPAEFRRMVYQFKPRLQPDGTFGAFDCPDGGQSAPKRTVSTTPLQALNLLNSSFIMQQASFFAERLHHDAGDDAAAQAQLAFRLCFARNATAPEAQAAVTFIQRHGLVLFCRAMFNANEFLYVT